MTNGARNRQDVVAISAERMIAAAVDARPVVRERRAESWYNGGHEKAMAVNFSDEAV